MNEELKAFYFNFAFDVTQRQPGTVVAVAKNEAEAREKFAANMTEFTNVELFEVIDLDEVPTLKEQVEQEQELQSNALEEFEAKLDDTRTNDEKKVH